MDAWVRALVALAPQLERGVVERHVVPLALSKAQAHETSVQARSPGAPRPCSLTPSTQRVTSMQGMCVCTQGVLGHAGHAEPAGGEAVPRPHLRDAGTEQMRASDQGRVETAAGARGVRGAAGSGSAAAASRGCGGPAAAQGPSPVPGA